MDRAFSRHTCRRSFSGACPRLGWMRAIGPPPFGARSKCVESAVWRMILRRLLDKLRQRLLSAPEALRKLAGGGASPRAGTTGTPHKMRTRPGGTMEPSAHRAIRSPLPRRVRFLQASGVPARGLASPPRRRRGNSGGRWAGEQANFRGAFRHRLEPRAL